MVGPVLPGAASSPQSLRPSSRGIGGSALGQDIVVPLGGGGIPEHEAHDLGRTLVIALIPSDLSRPRVRRWMPKPSEARKSHPSSPCLRADLRSTTASPSTGVGRSHRARPHLCCMFRVARPRSWLACRDASLGGPELAARLGVCGPSSQTASQRPLGGSAECLTVDHFGHLWDGSGERSP